MGRPVNDKFFVGDVSDNPGAKTGLQINVTSAFFSGQEMATSSAWIVRQRTPDKFEITDGSDIEVLQSNATSELAAGAFTLEVVPFFDQDTEFVRTISSHVVKTFEGNVYAWTSLQNGNEAAVVGEVDFSPTMS